MLPAFPPPLVGEMPAGREGLRFKGTPHPTKNPAEAGSSSTHTYACRSVVPERRLQQVELGLDAVLVVRLEGLDVLRTVDLAVEERDAVLQA